MTALQPYTKLMHGNKPVPVFTKTQTIWPVPPHRFSPLDIPGLLTWLDAQSLSLGYRETVSVWPDSSGNGRAATTATGSPFYIPDALNFHPAVRFGETTLDGMALDPGHSIGERTVFQVLRIDNPYISRGPYHTSQLQELDPYLQTYSQSGTIRTYANPVIDSGILWSGRTQFVNLWCSTAGTQTLEVDGVETSGAWSPSATNALFHLGGFVVAGYGMIGYIGEILIYERCLNVLERMDVRTYLQQKWALT